MNATLKRWGHSLTASSLGPGLTVVTVFGGTAEPLTGSDDSQPKLADTTLLQFSECTSDIHVHTVYIMHVYIHVYDLYKHVQYMYLAINAASSMGHV